MAATDARPWLIYTRVSTDEQARQGVSLEAQRESCIAYLKALGISTHEVLVDDGYSAWATGHMKRPGIRRILEAVRARSIAGVVVWALDRFIRVNNDLVSTIDLMAAHGVAFAAVSQHINTTGPMGRFQLQLFGALAELESGRTSERVRTAKAHIRAKGGWSGGRVPAGLKVVGDKGAFRLEVDPAKAMAVREAFEAYVAGDGLVEVGKRLAKAKAYDAPPTAANVAALIRRRALVEHGVVSDTLQRAAEAVLAGRRPGKRGPQAAPTESDRSWPLAGLAVCGSCGAPLAGIHAHGRGGRYPYLRCTGKVRGRCELPDLPAEAWERAVVEGLERSAADGRWSDAWARWIVDQLGENEEDRKTREALLEGKAKAQAQLDRLVDLVAEAGPEARTILARMKALEGEVATLTLQLASHQGRQCAVEVLELQRVAAEAALAKAIPGLSKRSPAEWVTILPGLLHQAALSVSPPGIRLETYVPGPQSGPGFVQPTELVLRSKQRTNPCRWPSIDLALQVLRVGQAWRVAVASEGATADRSSRALAQALGVSLRQAQRLRANGTGAARMGLLPPEVVNT